MAKYNLGSGSSNFPKGYINVDIDEKVNPDVVADVTITPWIWAKPNNSEEIRMNNLAEHLSPFIEVIKECHYVLKNKGILWIKVPFLKTDNKLLAGNQVTLENILTVLKELQESMLDCYSDPTHIGLKFTTRTFDYFDCNHSRWQKFGKSYGIPKFKRIKQQIKDRFLIIELEAIK